MVEGRRDAVNWLFVSVWKGGERDPDGLKRWISVMSPIALSSLDH